METDCLSPDLAPSTSYARGCRCPRCTTFRRDYEHGMRTHRSSRSSRGQSCSRCRKRGAELLVDTAHICWDCVTSGDRYRIWLDTYQGRYGRVGT